MIFERFDFNNDGKLSARELEAAIRHIIQREQHKQEQREDASREAIREQTQAKRGPDAIASAGDFIDKAFSNRPEDQAEQAELPDSPAAISTSARLFPAAPS